MKKYLFPLVLILIPILLLTITEIGLRLVGYGHDLSLFTPHPDLEGYLSPNPDAALRYFPAPAPTSFPTDDVFKTEKDENTIRIFVLGGSTTAGFPYFYNGCFTKPMQDRLQSAYPGYDFEVVNLGMSAVTSYTVRDFARICLHYKPDLLIIYTGHNEFYGALGSASTRSGGGTHRVLTLTYLKLKHLRLYQSIQNITSRLRPARITGDGTLMASLAADQAIPHDSRLYAKTREIYQANLDNILNWYARENIPVILSTLVSNLKDQPPFVSLPPDSLGARTIYQAAKAAEKNEHYAEAARLYSKARDQDGLRFRAGSDFNDIIRELGEHQGVFVCDTEAWFANLSPHGLIGNNLLLEHLHPNLEGQFQIAGALVNTITENNILNAIKPDIPVAAPQPPADYFRQRMAITGLDQRTAEIQLAVLKSGWPFQPDQRHLTLADFMADNIINNLALAVLRGEKNFWQAHLELAEYYRSLGKIEAAEKEIRALVRAFPRHWQAHQLLGSLAVLRQDWDSALTALQTTAELTIEPYSQKWIGAILLNRQQPHQALPYLEKALELAPTDYQAMYNLSGAYLITGHYEKALQLVRQLKEKVPAYPGLDQLYTQLENLVKK